MRGGSTLPTNGLRSNCSPSVYQFGYRIASIVGGALALVLAARMSWSLVYLLMGGLIGLMALVALQAPDTAAARHWHPS